MSEITYLDFDLLFEKADGGYLVRVWDSPAGQASQRFELPFSDLEMENLILRLGRARRDVRSVQSPDVEAAKTFGGRLFEKVFDGAVRTCLESSLYAAQQQGVGLRLRLRLTNVPELEGLPWEYLYNPALNRFLSLSVETPLVRYLDLPERIQPLSVKPPLRVLVMISSPQDYPALDVEHEWSQLEKAVGGLKWKNRLILDRLSKPTLGALQRQIRRTHYHIFHFIGHGTFDERLQTGVLLLEDSRGRGRPVSGEHIGTLLHDERSLRLAFLNACEGARTSASDPFAGTAQCLVQQGIPAVIAMQFEISDEAAIILTREFYSALTEGYPVDAALGEARKAIYGQIGDVEWGTPVLYLRAEDGRIFDIEPPPAVSIPSPQVKNAQQAQDWLTAVSKKISTEAEIDQEEDKALRLAKAAMAREGWSTAIGKLEDVLAAEPDNIEASEALNQARHEFEIACLYADGREHYEAGHWQEALECLRRVQDEKPDYRDVTALISLAEEKLVAEQAAAQALASTSGWRKSLLGATLSGAAGRYRLGVPVLLIILLTIAAVYYVWRQSASPPAPAPTGCQASGIFANLWHKYRLRLGCPLQDEPLSIVDCELAFENGHMFYRADCGHIYVLYEPGEAGTFQAFPDTYIETESGYSCPAVSPDPDHLFQPKRGFGAVWCDLGAEEAAIGWAVNEDEGCFDSSNGAPLIQEFEQGLIFRDSDGRSRAKAYVLFFKKGNVTLEGGAAEGTFVRDSY